MDGISSEPLKELARYWRGIADGAAGRPGRAALDPTEIPSLLDRILLIDVERAPLRFRHRLIGTRIVATVGRNTTGAAIGEELYGTSAGSVFAAYAQVVEQRAPMHAKGTVHFSEERTLAAEIVLLPLFNGDDVQIIVAGLDLAGHAPSDYGEPGGNPFEIRTDGPRLLNM